MCIFLEGLELNPQNQLLHSANEAAGLFSRLCN